MVLYMQMVHITITIGSTSVLTFSIQSVRKCSDVRMTINCRRLSYTFSGVITTEKHAPAILF